MAGLHNVLFKLEMWLDDERQQLLEEAAYSVKRGKLCNVAAFRRWRAVARAAGLPLRKLASREQHDLHFLRTKALAASGGIYISAGIHGDEPAATEALITWAEKNVRRLAKLPLLIQRAGPDTGKLL